MAFNINLLPLFLQIPDRAGTLLTLGRQRILFTHEMLAKALAQPVSHRELTQEIVFGALGYDNVCTMDVSDYEGADILFDLNNTVAPDELVSAHDAVFTGGTLEHVFHVSLALQHAASFVQPGGTLIHIAPVNGWINHGFYQLCPGLLLDYFAVNGWRIEASVMIHVLSKSERYSHWKLARAGYRDRKAEGVRQLHWCVARRLETATLDKVPLQTMYAAKHDTETTGALVPDFDTVEVVNGVIQT